MQVEEVEIDLVERIGDATVIHEHPEFPVAAGTFQTALKKQEGARFKGGERPAILAPPPSEIAFDLAVPPGASLQFAAGVDLGFHEAPVEVRFEVEVDGRKVFDRTLAPSRRVEDRDWVDARTEIVNADGRDVRVVLRTTAVVPAAEGAPIRCGWGVPRVTRNRSIPRSEASPRRPNVLFIVVDTLRADRLGCYGSGRPTSPSLDRFAADATVFEKAVSPSPWTWPSTASLLTGLYPYVHGVLNADRCYLPSTAATLAEALRDAHFTPYGVSANPLICRAQNFDQGFETFEEAFHDDAAEVTDRFLAWLDGNRAYRFFAYLHYFDPHLPYRPPSLAPLEEVLGHPLEAEERARYEALAATRRISDFWNQAPEAPRIRDLYDAEIRYWDSQFGRLLAALARQGLDDRTILVVTSDHGEELFDHGRVGHARTLYDELVLVPLVVHVPGAAPHRVAEQVETVQIPATLLELVGIAPPPGMVADGLPGVGTGREAADRPGFSTTERWENPEEAFLRNQNSIRDGGWKLIVSEDGQKRLFSLADDPGESKDVAAGDAPRVERLDSRLRKWIDATRKASLKGPGVEVPSPDLLERLRAMGYVEESPEGERTPR